MRFAVPVLVLCVWLGCPREASAEGWEIIAPLDDATFETDDDIKTHGDSPADTAKVEVILLKFLGGDPEDPENWSTEDSAILDCTPSGLWPKMPGGGVGEHNFGSQPAGTYKIELRSVLTGGLKYKVDITVEDPPE